MYMALFISRLCLLRFVGVIRVRVRILSLMFLCGVLCGFVLFVVSGMLSPMLCIFLPSRLIVDTTLWRGEVRTFEATQSGESCCGLVLKFLLLDSENWRGGFFFFANSTRSFFELPQWHFPGYTWEAHQENNCLRSIACWSSLSKSASPNLAFIQPRMWWPTYTNGQCMQVYKAVLELRDMMPEHNIAQ